MLLVPTVAWLLYRLVKHDPIILEGLASRLSKAMLVYIGLAVAYFIIFSSWENGLTTAGVVGLVADTRFFIFFLSTYLVFSGTKKKGISQEIMARVVSIPACIVAVIALLQVTLLPKDILKYFGFTPPKYQPVLYIDQDNIFLRARSTLRGPNELGAYLVTPLLLMSRWYAKSKKLYLWLAVLVLALIFSYSRSAAVALLLAGLIVYSGTIAGLFKHLSRKTWGRVVLLFSGLAVVVALLAVINTNTFSTLVLHNNRSNSSVGSTGERLNNVGNLVQEAVRHPLGNGLGTSGPASQYGTPNIPDNYYIQIVQEMGFLGLIAFLCACFYLWKSLHRIHTAEARIVAACFVGLMVSNFFLHNWADDTLSMYFFGLSGWLLAVSKKTSTKSES